MNKRTVALVATSVLLLVTACGGGSRGDRSPPAGSGPPPTAGPPAPEIVDETGVPPRSDASRIAIIDVTVVPMDRETSLSGQTVLVENGVITAIDDSATSVIPADAERIDGTGRFLVPGLIDMHAHLLTEAGAEHDLGSGSRPRR